MTPAKATEKAPEVFLVRFTTTKGDFTVEAHRSWAPNGADRFYNMVRAGYLDDCAFFRAVKGFMVQFGMNGKPEVNGAWSGAMFPDDPPSGQSNKRGMVTFAMAGPNTRTTQLFINFGDNTSLDGMGFTPFGTVKQGMEVVDTLYTGYGDFPSFGGRGPNPSRIATEGNGFLRSSYPQLDYIKTARLVQ
ncbi:MAG: peptidylprolyl isomerase [Elusimicrobia bacterium]|nr:peptidylprolyl isomerase [Elusimicrobiota bacterium]